MCYSNFTGAKVQVFMMPVKWLNFWVRHYKLGKDVDSIYLLKALVTVEFIYICLKSFMQRSKCKSYNVSQNYFNW